MSGSDLFVSVGADWRSRDGRTVPRDDGTDPPPPPPHEVWYGHIDGARGDAAMETALRNSIALAAPARVGTFLRGYSGTSHPSVFSSSSVSGAVALAAAESSGKYGAMLNVKRPDWQALADGEYDELIAGFYQSWPVEVYGEVVINHEPENDGPLPANTSNPTYVSWATTNGPIWQAGINRYIDVAAPIIRARNLDVKIGACLMNFSWDSTRWQYFTWWEGITPANINEVVFGLDAYVKTVNGTPPVGYDMRPQTQLILNVARSAGISHFSLYEFAVDKRERFNGNVVVGTDQSNANWYPIFCNWLDAQPEVRMACQFHTPGGPASDQAQLNGPALPVWANICMNGRRP